MEKSNIQNIGESVLGKAEYAGLRKFFSHVWKSDYEYIVIFARRCYALHDILMQTIQEDAPLSPDEITEKVISNNAFFLYASEFATRYKETGAFPRVILVDDLLLYGRGMARHLFKFEKLIIDELENRYGLSDGARHSLHHDLIKAVSIYVYAMNPEPVFIEGLYCRDISAETRRPPQMLKELSQKISSFIQRANEPNTSYRFSIRIPSTAEPEPTKIKNWHSVSWYYRGVERTVYFPRNAECSKFIPAVYTHGLDSFNSNGSKWLTGFAVGGDISRFDFDIICDGIKSELKNASPNGFNWLCKLLDLKQNDLQAQRTQLVSFILSLVAVHEFYKDCNIRGLKKHQTINKSSAKHIAANFGRYCDVWEDIEALCTNQILLDVLQRKLFTQFNRVAEPITGYTTDQTASHGASQEDIKTINELTEDIIYYAGTQSDIDAYEISCNRKIFNPNLRGSDVVLLSDVLSDVNSHQKDKGISANIYDFFACQIALADSGLAAMNFEYDVTNEKIKCTLKAGELSTFVLPRRFHWFIPALSYVERQRYGLSREANKLLKEFIEYLSASNVKPETEVERDALAMLKERGATFVDALYQSGQRVRNWDMNLLTDGDWKEQRDDNDTYYLSFLMHNMQRQHYYVDKAKEFIEAKRIQRGY